MVNVAEGKSRTDIKFKDAVLLIDYIYLDSEERKRFAQASHEYLIEQLQFTGEESVNTANEKFRLNFNHPCKALYWSLKLGNYTTGKSSVAIADNGNVDIERFAKVMWMATRVGTSNKYLKFYPFNSCSFGAVGVIFKYLGVHTPFVCKHLSCRTF